MNKLLSLVILVLFTGSGIFAQEYKTIIYFKNDSIQLELDLFVPKVSVSKTPLMIFVHGGGFASGDRTSGHTFCKYAAEHGVAAASITYTLYMKGKDFGCKGILTEKIKAMKIAANQLWQATFFFCKNSNQFNIDTTQIFIGGNSAGAETSLHAAYWDRKVMAIYPNRLSSTFRYAGLIGGSGAIMDLNLMKPSNLIPIFLSHGNCDPMVPYATAAHRSCDTDASGWLMLFGSYSIYNHLIGYGASVLLYTYCGGGHEFSDDLFRNKPEAVLDFVRQCLTKVKFQEHHAFATGKSCEQALEYNLCK